ncbi:MAG TPA: iron ABC transporter permease [Candidatus Acidoferrales bacterium]|nr:iron ABC transporter permease [Candidatus Acidoferrales bacterium]
MALLNRRHDALSLTSGFRARIAPGRWDGNHALFFVTGLALAYLVVPPLYFILMSSLVVERGSEAGSFTLEHYENIFASLADFNRLIWNSFLFSCGSALGALSLGTLLAWLAERTNAPFRAVAYVFAFISFGIPGIVKVIGWILLLGPEAGLINVIAADLTGVSPVFNVFSMAGMILVEALLWTPVVFLLMATPFRSMDPALEEAALVAGSKDRQVFWRVTLPLALPSALAVLILTFIRSLEAFEIPALIGLPAGLEVLTTKIYLQIRSSFIPRYGEASAYSILLMVVVGVVLFCYHKVTGETHRFTTVTGKGYRPRRVDLRRWRWLGGALLLTLPLLQLLPLVALIWSSFLPYAQPPSAKAFSLLTLKNYTAAFSDNTIVWAILNSVTISVAAASATVVLTFVAAWLVVRTNISQRWALDQLATAPLVFPGLVMGVAILKMYLAIPLPIYGTIWIIALAFLTRYLPYGMRFSYAGLLSIHRELEESSAACGGSWGHTIRKILIPLMLPALFSGWIYIFLITIRELSLALLLYSPGSQVISVTIWELWENGRIGELAAFSLVITVATVLLAVLLHRFSQRYSLQV